jgi:hypothetical protein
VISCTAEIYLIPLSEPLDISKLEDGVRVARERIKALMKAHRLAMAGQPCPFDTLRVAQRELAAAKGEQYAVPLDVDFRPETAASEPVLLQTERQTFLTFSALQKFSDGKYHEAGHAVIEFEKCNLRKFGYPYNEALPSHPLYEKGLHAYGIYRVINSEWIKQITEQNRVSLPGTPESTANHFIFTFRNSTFECIAAGFKATVSSDPYEKIFAEITRKVFGLRQD